MGNKDWVHKLNTSPNVEAKRTVFAGEVTGDVNLVTLKKYIAVSEYVEYSF